MVAKYLHCSKPKMRKNVFDITILYNLLGFTVEKRREEHVPYICLYVCVISGNHPKNFNNTDMIIIQEMSSVLVLSIRTDFSFFLIPWPNHYYLGNCFVYLICCKICPGSVLLYLTLPDFFFVCFLSDS